MRKTITPPPVQEEMVAVDQRAASGERQRSPVTDWGCRCSAPIRELRVGRAQVSRGERADDGPAGIRCRADLFAPLPFLAL